MRNEKNSRGLKVLNPARSRAGFTLLELLATIGVIVILILLFIGVAQRLPGAADRAACTANLRSLRVALDTYLQTEGHWPDVPEFSAAQEEARADWWINELKPYGIIEKNWQCPGILRLGRIQQKGYSPRLHYTVTEFDQKPETPKKWPHMPWVVENANVHGHGALCVLLDGSVHDWDLYIEKFVD